VDPSAPDAAGPAAADPAAVDPAAEATAPAPDTIAPDAAPDAAPAALADLIAAGLVSHEMIGDPARLGGEAASLRALCGLVAGPVYRIDAYHYAFRAGPDDLDGALGRLAPGEWTDALEAALAEALGTDAVWLNATDLLPEAGAALAQPLLLLRAQAAAVTAALETAAPELQAVINARYAAEVARLTADADVGGPLAALASLTATLATMLQRLDAQSQVLHTHIAREDQVAARLAEISDLAATPQAFQETIGLTLAEFLAQIERRDAEAAGGQPAPQLS
jgi:hypothetical protein